MLKKDGACYSPPYPQKNTLPKRKIRIVFEGLRYEDSIAELCRRFGIIVPHGFASLSSVCYFRMITKKQ